MAWHAHLRVEIRREFQRCQPEIWARMWHLTRWEVRERRGSFTHSKEPAPNWRWVNENDHQREHLRERRLARRARREKRL